MKKILILLSIFALAHSLDVTCNFDKFNWIGGGDEYTCYAQFDYIEDRDVETILGDHKGSSKDDDVKAVQINDQSCGHLLQGLTKFFKNMNQLFIFKSDLMYIGKHDLKEYTALKTLALSRNHLSQIPWDAFEDMVNLEELSLSFNQLISVPNLRTLSKLRLLYLFENSISSLKSDDLSENVSLEVLWIYQNKLKEIDSGILNLPVLREAKFNNNKCINRDFIGLDKAELKSEATALLDEKCPVA